MQRPIIHPHLRYIILFFVFSSCTLFEPDYSEPEIDLSNPIADKSFVTEEICAPPCWYGIILDDPKAKEEILETIDQLPFVIKDSVFGANAKVYNGDMGIMFFYSCEFLSKTNIDCGYVTIVEGKIREISYIVGYPLTVKDVVLKLGEPESYFIRPESGGGCSILLFWPLREIIISFQEFYFDTECQNAMTAGLNPNLQVFDVSYLSETVFLPCTTETKFCIEWPGFGVPLKARKE